MRLKRYGRYGSIRQRNKIKESNDLFGRKNDTVRYHNHNTGGLQTPYGRIVSLHSLEEYGDTTLRGRHTVCPVCPVCSEQN
jgi:hypothetical protein